MKYVLHTTPLQTKRNLKRNKQTNTHHSGLCKESDRDRSGRRANSNKILHLAERKKCISAYHVLLLFDTVNDARKPNQSTTYDTTNPNVNVTINSPTISVESGTDANLEENLHKTQFLFILLNSFQSTKRAHTHTHGSWSCVVVFGLFACMMSCPNVYCAWEVFVWFHCFIALFISFRSLSLYLSLCLAHALAIFMLLVVVFGVAPPIRRHPIHPSMNRITFPCYFTPIYFIATWFCMYSHSK